MIHGWAYIWGLYIDAIEHEWVDAINMTRITHGMYMRSLVHGAYTCGGLYMVNISAWAYAWDLYIGGITHEIHTLVGLYIGLTQERYYA